MDLKQEFIDNARNPRVGSVLVSESERVRVWHLTLAPGERLPVHLHQADYFWTAISNGRGRAHYVDGSSEDVVYTVGDTSHQTFPKGGGYAHSLENIGDSELRFVTVEFSNGENPVLPLD
ncbi:MAG: cupin domain-containing protein [Acidimicrobiia bacterium]